MRHNSCQSHCCLIHKCKYSYEDCPVSLGEVKQDGLCYHCDPFWDRTKGQRAALINKLDIMFEGGLNEEEAENIIIHNLIIDLDKMDFYSKMDYMKNWLKNHYENS